MKLKLIKNALVYKAELPHAEALAKHLEEKPFVDPEPMAAGSIGFVPRDGYTMVDVFHGGVSFMVRIDEKIIPAGAVRAELDKRAKEACESMGLKRLPKDEKAMIKDMIIAEFRHKALIKTTHVTCFYDIKHGHLVIPTTSKTTAGAITSLLIHAVGSVKTETIHVSDVKHGLTTRMIAWIEGDDEAFGEFYPCEEVALEQGSQKMTIKMDSISNANAAIKKAIGEGFKVKSMRLLAGASEVKFRLTSDFAFKAIDFPVPVETEDYEDAWKHEASVQLLNFSAIVNEMCEMFGYKEPEQEKEAA